MHKVASGPGRNRNAPSAPSSARGLAARAGIPPWVVGQWLANQRRQDKRERALARALSVEAQAAVPLVEVRSLGMEKPGPVRIGDVLNHLADDRVSGDTAD